MTFWDDKQILLTGKAGLLRSYIVEQLHLLEFRVGDLKLHHLPITKSSIYFNKEHTRGVNQ
jgi:hypothetical protein